MYIDNYVVRYINDYYDDFVFDDKWMNPDVNRIPNPLFPDQSNIYKSNCVEFWKYITDNEVPGIEQYRYLISSWGNTWDCLLNKPISFTCSAGNKFYIQLNLKLSGLGNVTRKLHRLILMLFWPIENPHLYQVNHIDCSHDVNNLYNLEWCDDSYNRVHSIINGVGGNIFYSDIVMFTEEQVHQMYVLREIKGYTYKQIYEEMNLREKGDFERIRKTIEKITHGKSKLFSRFYN